MKPPSRPDETAEIGGRITEDPGTVPLVVPDNDLVWAVPPPPPPTPPAGVERVVTWGSARLRACVHIGAWSEGKACAICYSVRDQEARANKAESMEIWLRLKSARLKLAQIAAVLASSKEEGEK